MTKSVVFTAVLAALALPSFASAQLQIGGQQSNYGGTYMQRGTPDPMVVAVVSGGAINASNAVRVSGCRGFVSRAPDHIVTLPNPRRFLRFFAESAGDTTLIINDPNGNWYCNDDAVGRNPMIDFRRAPAGQYDVWVGSYSPRQNQHANLVVTQRRNVQPGQQQVAVQQRPPQYQQPPQYPQGNVQVTVQGQGGYVQGGVAVQPQYGQPQYGQPQYGQPQYGQPQYGQPQPQYGGYDFHGQFEQTPVNFSGATIDAVYQQCIQFTASARLTMVDDVVVNGVAARNGPGYWDNAALCAIVALNVTPRGQTHAHVSGSVEGLPFNVAGDMHTVQRILTTFLPIAVAHDNTIDDIVINGQAFHNGPGYWTGADVAAMAAAQIHH